MTKPRWFLEKRNVFSAHGDRPTLLTPALPLDLLQRENTIKTCLVCSYVIVLINKRPIGRTVTALQVFLLGTAVAAARAAVASC